MQKRIRRCAALLLLLMFVIVAFSFPISVNAEDDAVLPPVEEGVVDYILILDCTSKAAWSDSAENSRKAAAKLFVDLLPVDNARVGVFAITNPDDSPGNPDRYKLRADNGHVADADYRFRCIDQIWDLNDSISSKTDRDKLKNLIDKNYEAKNSPYSDTHVALYAVMDTLKFWQSESACVMLISEEFAANYTYHKELDTSGKLIDPQDHTMLDDVGDCFTDHNWAVSWLNLAEESSDASNRKDLINLCSVTGGYVYEDKLISKLPQNVAEVIRKYSGAKDAENEPLVLGSSGQLEYPLPSFAMLTEINIVVTGDGVEKISVMDGDGVVTTDKQSSDVLWFSKQYDSANSNRFFYSALKAIRPSSGGWTITVDGEPGSQVFVQTVQTLEPDILLISDCEAGANLSVGQTIQFNGTFQYAGQKLRCGEDAYKNYSSGARLVCENLGSSKTYEIPLSVDGEQYLGTFHAKESGSYRFILYVDSNDFKSYTRQSNIIDNISVENHPPKVVSAMPNIDGVQVGSELEKIDMALYFVEPDGQELSYLVTCVSDRSVVLDYQIVDGYMVLRAPLSDGDYQLEIIAQDDCGGKSEANGFHLGVINNPPTVAGLPKRIDLVANAPEFLVKLGLITKEQGEAKRFLLSEYFKDPDNLPLTFEYRNDSNLNDDSEEIISLEGGTYNVETGEISLVPSAAGDTTVVFSAVDSAGAVASHEIRVSVKGAGSILFKRFWPVPVAIAVLVLIICVLRASRRVRGSWDVTVTDERGVTCSHRFTSLAATGRGNLKRTSVAVRYIVNAAIDLEDMSNEMHIEKPSYKNPMMIGTLLEGKSILVISPDNDMSVSVAGNDVGKGKIKVSAKKEIVLSFIQDGVNYLTISMLQH